LSRGKSLRTVSFFFLTELFLFPLPSRRYRWRLGCVWRLDFSDFRLRLPAEQEEQYPVLFFFVSARDSLFPRPLRPKPRFVRLYNSFARIYLRLSSFGFRLPLVFFSMDIAPTGRSASRARSRFHFLPLPLPPLPVFADEAFFDQANKSGFFVGPACDKVR